MDYPYKKSNDAPDSRENIRCSLCTENEEQAEIFCPDCDMALCAEHLQEHENSRFFAQHINIMAMDAYADKRMKYEKRKCQAHELPFELYCAPCKQPGCCKCGFDSTNLCMDTGTPHCYESLRLLELKIADCYEKMVRKMTDKQNELRDMQKVQKQQLSNLEEVYLKKKESLNLEIKLQFETIAEMWSNIDQHLADNYDSATKKLIQYETETIEPAIDRLAALTARVGTSLRQKHVIDLLADEEAISSEVKIATDGSYNNVPDSCLHTVTRREDYHLQLPVIINRPKLGLQFLKNLDTKRATAVTHSQNGTIISRSVDGLEYREMVTKSCCKVAPMKSVLGLCYCDRKIYILQRGKVLVYSQDGNFLLTFPVGINGSFMREITVIADMLFIPNRDHLLRYSLTGSAKKPLPLPAGVTNCLGVCAGLPGHIIVADREFQTVRSINISTGTNIWTYNIGCEIQSAMTSDPGANLVFVGGLKTSKIIALSLSNGIITLAEKDHGHWIIEQRQPNVRDFFC